VSKKIAPALSWHIQDPFASDPQAFREAVPQMVRELRAMLAVVRAVRRRGRPDCRCSTCRALSRLARVSKGER
jgi:hypothetical protein